MRLRRHQDELRSRIELVREEIERESEIVVQAAPGAGKSMLPVIAAAGLIPDICDRVCWLVPRTTLREQAAQAFLDKRFRAELGHDLEIIQAVNDENPCRGTAGYTTTYQAILNDVTGTHMREFSAHRYLLVIDEFHHLYCGGEFASAVRRLEERAAFVLRMTGTAYRHSGEPIAGIQYDADGLPVKDGWIVYSVADAIRERAIREVAFSYVDAATRWEEAATGAIENADCLDDDPRALFTALRTEYATQLLDDAVDDWLRYKSDQPWSKLLVVCSQIREARRMVAHLRDRRALRSVEIATSHDPKADLRVEEFRMGGLNILVTVAKCYEGLDVPDITHIACLTNIRSAPWIQQMIARAWRFVPRIPWGAQRARVFVPNDAAMREICEQLKDQIEEAIKIRDESSGTGEREVGAREEDDVIPLSSQATVLLSGTLTNGMLDPELSARAQHVIRQQELPLTPDQLIRAFELMQRNPVSVDMPSAPEVTAGKRCKLLRDQILRHTRRWSAKNGRAYKLVNEEILRAGFRRRTEMTEPELLELLEYVRKRWPLE